MTVTEKILAAHADRDRVKPGDLIQVRVDQTFMDDLGGPITIKILEENGITKVFDPDRVFVTPMVNTPAITATVANTVKMMRDFAKRMKIQRFWADGMQAIHNAVAIEQGLVLPGELLAGGNSHACTGGGVGAFATGMGSTDIAAVLATGRTWLRVPETIRFHYGGTLQRWVTGKDLMLETIRRIGVAGALGRAIEFGGDALRQLSVEERFALPNMAVEAGALNGIIEPDEAMLEYVRPRAKRNFAPVYGDADAAVRETHAIDVSSMAPVVALPHKPGNGKPLPEVGRIGIDQVYIGSCTNGWITDMRAAAKILKGRKIARNTRLIVIPSTSEIYRQCVHEGIAEIVADAGGVFSPTTCGPCIGAHMGVLGDGERSLSTSNRNFVGRQGSPKAEVYLCNPWIAAASAVLGYIGSPDELE